MTQKEPKIIPLEVVYSVFLKGIIFPVDYRDLRFYLSKYGYQLTPAPGSIPPRPTRIGFAGDIAVKEENVVGANTDEKEFRITGRSMEKVLGTYKELTDILLKEGRLDINKDLKYTQLVAHYQVDSGKKAIEQLAKFIKDDPRYKKFGDVLKEPVSIFDVRLTPRGAIPNQEDWFDIAIEHDVLWPDTYHIGIVKRNEKKEIIDEFIRNLDKTLISLISIIEGD